MKAPGRSSDISQRALIVAMGAVVLSFLLSTIYSQARLSRLDLHATAIVERGVPSIERLAATRTALRRVLTCTDAYVDSFGAPEAVARARQRAELDEAMGDLGRSIVAYGELPAARGREALFAPVPGIREQLIESLGLARAEAEAGRVREAREVIDGRVATAAGELDGALLRLVQLHIDSARQHARSIEEARRSQSFVAWTLDGVSLALAVLAAALAVRITRRQTRAIEERSSELELFASRLAHDVLGPLTAAAVALEVARRRAASSHDTMLGEQVERGRASLERSKRIADGLLSFARAGARPEPGARADVREVIEGVVDEVRGEAERAGATVVTEAIPPVAAAIGSGALLSVIGNLVRNALKHMGERAERQVTVRVVERGSLVRIEVEDTGPGVPAELRRTIFEPYVRAPAANDQPGLGLGLATVKRISEAYGGAVGCAAGRTGIGSLFWVELPRAR